MECDKGREREVLQTMPETAASAAPGYLAVVALWLSRSPLAGSFLPQGAKQWGTVRELLPLDIRTG